MNLFVQSPPTDTPPKSAEEQANINRLVMVITFLLIFIMAARTPLDSDMFWHLRAGEEMLRLGHVLRTDILSFTRAGAAWTNPYWIAQVGMALVFNWQGWLGLGGAVAVLATLSMFLVYLQCEGPVFLKAAALLLGSVVASVVWSPRPQLLSLVWMGLVGFLLYLYKWRGQDKLWGLPLVFIVWTNTHAGYPLGLILIGAMLAGETLNHLLGAGEGDKMLSWRQMIRLGLWGAACGLAVLINPNGLGMWRLPFQTVDMRVLQQFIPEWGSPDFHNLLEQSVLWLLLLVFAAAGLAGRRMDGTDLVTVLGMAYMALLARRNFGPFAVAATPVLTRCAAAALQNWRANAPWLERLEALTRSRSGSKQAPPALKKGINLALVGLLGLVAFSKLFIVTHPALYNSYLNEGFPTRAVAWLQGHRETGRMLNEYNWGGYLQWALPAFPTFVDGRTDIFGDEIVGAWISAIQGSADWKEILARYQVDLVMLQPDRPLLQQLPGAGWKLLYQDTQVVIYGRE